MDAGALTVDDLLNFNFDVGVEDNNKENTQKAPTPDFHQGLALPEFAEEELEWLLNKEAFPSLDSCLDILSDPPTAAALNHHSPVSVLDAINLSNASNIKNNLPLPLRAAAVPIRYPMKPRSTISRQRRKLSRFPDPPTQHFLIWGQENAKKKLQLQQQQQHGDAVGRKCSHCQVDKTPQWRAGPMGPKTLCNACGVRYKSGRLVPEYRPANSPTFSSSLHSNSHRKVVEMRRQKQLGVNEPCANSRVA